jgi:hypothetical protein
MARHRVGTISYALFFLALVEVLAWSLPMVHSATGGSTEDLQGYFHRETHNTAEVDTSIIHKHELESHQARDIELQRYVGEEEAQLLNEDEKLELAKLTDLMSLGFIVRSSLLHLSFFMIREARNFACWAAHWRWNTFLPQQFFCSLPYVALRHSTNPLYHHGFINQIFH